MRTRVFKSLSLLTVSFAVLALSTPTMAQWGYSQRAQISRLIRQAESRSDVFASMIERMRGRDRIGFRDQGYDNFNRYGLRQRAAELERELNAVAREFQYSRNTNQVRDDLARALDTARGIENAMDRRDLNSGVERQWILLRSDLNRLARVYSLPQVG